MVSSTFFDLREIRHQLAKMIETDLSYRAFISESMSFPIEPDAGTIENCRRRVEEDADILVLVIGSRLGSIDQRSGKSVTNVEYLAARAKGIPLYAFVERRTLTLFEAWAEASTEHKSSLAASVSDARLFDFIQSVRSEDSVWMNAFDTSDDIIRVLRTQLSFLMMSGLSLRTKLRSHPDRALLNTLSPQAFRIAVDRPKLWEYLLFSQIIHDETERVRDQRRRYDLGITLGPVTMLSDSTLLPWLRGKLHEVMKLINSATTLVNDTLKDAAGPPGVPGNMREIVFVARELGEIYSSLIEWTQDVRRVQADDDFRAGIDAVAFMTSEMIQSIGSWGAELHNGIQSAQDDLITNPPTHGEIRTASFSLSLTVPSSSDAFSHFAAAYEKRGVKIVP